MEGSFDYVIVGAGSAGCVLASRLTEDPSVRVLLIESGGPNNHWTVDMPLAVERAIASSKRNWKFVSQPEPYLGGRTILHPRGRGLGGSSSINGMVYVRGHALDYDGWADRDGCKGWSYFDVLPYFKRSEHYEGGGDRYRGGSGPLPVSIPRLSDNVLNVAFVEAGREAGYPVTTDVNGYQQEGFGASQNTTKGGTRCGTARAYLAPARRRDNLAVRDRAHVTRILFEGKRAIGVEYQIGGVLHEVEAAREVILSAGAFHSPQLLMLSGVGPADHLKANGIEVLHDLPAVGQNLQDHPDIVLQQWCSQPVSLYSSAKGLGKIRTGLQWFLTKTGVGASNQFHAAGYIRTRAGVKFPDVRLEFIPIGYSDHLDLLPGHAYQVHATLMRPDSRGHVALDGPNPLSKPKVAFNYFKEASDVTVMRDAVRLVREILSQNAIKQYSGAEIAPGAVVQSDAAIDQWMRDTSATGYHVCGTCKMGPAGNGDTVVDASLKVHGVEGLRVIDASIMPLVTSSNTNGPTIMIGEKGADLVKGKPPLPREEVPVWINPNWQTVQR